MYIPTDYTPLYLAHREYREKGILRSFSSRFRGVDVIPDPEYAAAVYFLKSYPQGSFLASGVYRELLLLANNFEDAVLSTKLVLTQDWNILQIPKDRRVIGHNYFMTSKTPKDDYLWLPSIDWERFVMLFASAFKLTFPIREANEFYKFSVTPVQKGDTQVRHLYVEKSLQHTRSYDYFVSNFRTSRIYRPIERIGTISFPPEIVSTTSDDILSTHSNELKQLYFVTGAKIFNGDRFYHYGESA